MEVHGRTIDDATRCVHYHLPEDVVAIKFACCGRYYPCFSCHAEAEDHVPQRWPESAWSEPAVLCGVCRSELTIESYRRSTSCPHCAAPFNPRCSLHAHLYFEVSEAPPSGGQTTVVPKARPSA